MDAQYTAALVDLGKSLTELAVKGTASAIASRVKAIQDEKNVEKVRQTYDEIINELLSEREEAIRIAQVYRDELERVQISDDDIQHLHNTIERILELTRGMYPEDQHSNLQSAKELISADTLKAIQLLGFNYKAAFGEPLTEVCAQWIKSKLVPQESANTSKEKRAVRR